MVPSSIVNVPAGVIADWVSFKCFDVTVELLTRDGIPYGYRPNLKDPEESRNNL